MIQAISHDAGAGLQLTWWCDDRPCTRRIRTHHAGLTSQSRCRPGTTAFRPRLARITPARPESPSASLPFAPGGSTISIVARIIPRSAWQKQLGQQIIIDNRPGAGGTVRHSAGREERARRLHDRPRLYRDARHRPVAVSQCRLRRAQGLRADRPHRQRAEHARGPSVVCRAFGAGADRLCQGEPRQGQLRLGRRRHGRPCRR